MPTRSLSPYDYLSPEERAAIAEIEASTSILRLVTRLTQMNYAAIAKFTEQEWVACSVYDPLGIGPEPDEAAALESTVCDEFRTHPEALLVPSLSADARLGNKPIVKQFNLGSYAGVPIFLPDGRLFGALCALDAAENRFEDGDLAETLGLFARLIGCIFFASLEQTPRPTPTPVPAST